MNIHRLGLTAIGMCVTMMCASIGLARAQNQTPGVEQMNAQQEYREPHKDMDDAASRVQPTDDNSVRAVANAVFNFPHSYPHMDAAVEAVAIARLVQAEKAYLQKQRPGVEEQAVVNVINALADKFAAPDYAKTSVLQVRYIRMTQALNAPNFMGRGVARPGAKIGDSVGTELSPLQAAHLIAVVLDQKFINPDFQVPPDEWDQGYQGLSDELHARQKARDSGAPSVARFSMRSNPKRRELSDVMSKSLTSLSAQDSADLVDQMFTTLGIEIGGGRK
jgi:hypothetical protein